MPGFISHRHTLLPEIDILYEPIETSGEQQALRLTYLLVNFSPKEELLDNPSNLILLWSCPRICQSIMRSPPDDVQAFQTQLWMSTTSMIESSLPGGFSILAILSLGSAAATNCTHSSLLLSWEFSMLNICRSIFLREAMSEPQSKKKELLSRDSYRVHFSARKE